MAENLGLKTTHCAVEHKLTVCHRVISEEEVISRECGLELMHSGIYRSQEVMNRLVLQYISATLLLSVAIVAGGGLQVAAGCSREKMAAYFASVGHLRSDRARALARPRSSLESYKEFRYDQQFTRVCCP